MIISSSSQQTAIQVYEKAVDYYRFEHIRSMDDALNNACPALSKINATLAKKDNPDQLSNMLKIMLIGVAKDYNITRNLERAQVDKTVKVILSEFNYFKLSEVYYIFKQASLGRVKKTFERLDVPTVVSWFDDWAAERADKFEERSLQQHDRATAGEKDRQYDNFLEKLQIQQSNEQQKEVKELAFKMAKKMVTNKFFKDADTAREVSSGKVDS